MSDDIKTDGLCCLWIKWNSSNFFTSIGPFIRIVATSHIAFSWLPFPIGQVSSRVWGRPYLMPHFSFFDLQMFPWSLSKVQLSTFYPSHSKLIPSMLRLCLRALVWSPVKSWQKKQQSDLTDHTSLITPLTGTVFTWLWRYVQLRLSKTHQNGHILWPSSILLMHLKFLIIQWDHTILWITIIIILASSYLTYSLSHDLFCSPGAYMYNITYWVRQNFKRFTQLLAKQR